jgi:hypothetical protein
MQARKRKWLLLLLRSEEGMGRVKVCGLQNATAVECLPLFLLLLLLSQRRRAQGGCCRQIGSLRYRRRPLPLIHQRLLQWGRSMARDGLPAVRTRLAATAARDGGPCAVHRATRQHAEGWRAVMM